mmetsp:Transcript_44363/g.87633  ORF Transcript_44363/g.87633 Transcript_44363/m.87633 type:complete len:109 (-) Transcript_44363:3807-4133(-)
MRLHPHFKGKRRDQLTARHTRQSIFICTFERLVWAQQRGMHFKKDLVSLPARKKVHTAKERKPPAHLVCLREGSLQPLSQRNWTNKKKRKENLMKDLGQEAPHRPGVH